MHLERRAELAGSAASWGRKKSYRRRGQSTSNRRHHVGAVTCSLFGQGIACGSTCSHQLANHFWLLAFLDMQEARLVDLPANREQGYQALSVQDVARRVDLGTCRARRSP